MATIKMTKSVATPLGVLTAGKIYEVPDKLANDLLSEKTAIESNEKALKEHIIEYATANHDHVENTSKKIGKK